MTIRNLEKNDAAGVALLIPQLTKNIIDPKNLTERIGSLADARDCQYLVAELEGNIVGFCGLAWYQIPSKGLVGWVEEVVVDEAFRGKGIATTMLLRLLVLAKQKNIAVVKLTSNSSEASHVYEKLGFAKKHHEYFSLNI